MPIHANSMESWHELEPGERHRVILECYRSSPVPLTDREVAHRLGFRDLNAVRPRITELIELGHVCECADVKDKTTNRTVRACTNTTIF